MTQNEILDKAQYWATNPAFDAQTQKEITDLIESKNDKELLERFYRDLEFGTGGLRGVLGAGTNRMNVYNIRKATLALSRYLKKVYANEDEIRVAISFDSRQFSPEFSQAAAEILAANSIKTYITKELRPVPMLSFMTRMYKCHAGICVTASHNPPEYNGFKVYWTDGGQLVSPHDKNIIEQYNAIQDYGDISRVAFDEAVNNGSIKVVGKELDDAYIENVKTLSVNASGRDNFKIVYSPLHGSGLTPVTKALNAFGFNDLHIVKEQADPDGMFPTVTSPNPEDSAAMSLGLNLAKELSADVVMATDPDADRLGAIVKSGDDYITLNGNQIASLLAYYILEQRKQSNSLDKDGVLIKTIVTTDLIAKIAEDYGLPCLETLTGFKWIASLIEGFENGTTKPYKSYIFGGEESYGYLAGTFVRDKDAVSTAALFCEMLAVNKSQGITIDKALHTLYEKYGVFQESLHTITLKGKEGSEKIQSIMETLRKQPPLTLANSKVIQLKDYQLQKDYAVTNGKLDTKGTIDLPKSNVLQLFTEDGCKVSIRPSGTEPKIKFYFAIQQQTDGSIQESVNKASQRLEEIKASIEQLIS